MEQNTLRKQRELTDRLNRYRNEYYTALCTASFSDCWGKNARFPCLKTAACWNGWSSIMLRISSRIAESQILFCEH